MEARIIVLFTFLSIGVLCQEECPAGHGWIRYGRSCYLFVTHVADDWTGSEYFCSLLHSKLVEIETAAENEFLKQKCRDNDDAEDWAFWIGGIDAVYEGDWFWVKSQKKFNFTDWAPNFPDDYLHNEDCAQLFKKDNYKWNDDDCNKRMSFICESELDMDPIAIIG